MRIPGPSWIENRWMSKTRPFVMLPVFHTGNDVLLQVGREPDEEFAEAGNADDEVLV